MKWLVIICVVVGLVLWLAMRKPPHSPAAPQGASTAVEPAAPKVLPAGYDPSKKAERDKLMDELQAKGLFGSMDVREHFGHVEIKPGFELLDFKVKQDFAGAFWAWCLDTDIDCRGVLLLRAGDHHTYATYSPAAGFTVK